MRFPALLAALLLTGCAAAPTQPTPGDPFERVNRATYRFNDTVDKAVVKPAAQAYQKVVPQLVRTGVGNFLSNLGYPLVFANNVLQLKPKAAAQDLGRLVANFTLGLGGLLDPASQAFGLPRHDEDFGQTLGYWGVPAGPYLMLPFLGPSTLRDAPAMAAEQFVDPRELIDDEGTRFIIVGLKVLDLRAELLATDRFIAEAYDPYAFVRNAWLQRRQYLVTDGASGGEEPLEEPLEDPEPEADAPAPDAPAGDPPPAR